MELDGKTLSTDGVYFIAEANTPQIPDGESEIDPYVKAGKHQNRWSE